MANTDPNSVADASSLIVLAKLNALEVLYTIYGPVALTETVSKETILQGKAGNHDDALLIEAAVERGWLVQVTLTEKQRRLSEAYRAASRAIDLGEAEAIAYAEDTGAFLVIEDRKAKVIARARGVQYTTIQMLPFEGYVKALIDYDMCIDLMERVAVAMRTDIGVLMNLKTAALSLRRVRLKQE